MFKTGFKLDGERIISYNSIKFSLIEYDEWMSLVRV